MFHKASTFLLLQSWIHEGSVMQIYIRFLLLSLLASGLYGLSLDEVISKAMNKSPSLESIQHRISANRYEVDASGQFSNPEISYVQNTLDKDQAMSRQTLTLKQNLPYFGKRERRHDVAQAEEEVLKENLEEAKVKLVNAIKNQAYTVWELEELYKILHEYEELTRQNIELFESYTSTSDNQHMGIMSAELTLSDLRIQESILKAEIYKAYARLSYLAAFEIKDLDIELVMWDLPEASVLQEGLVRNHAHALKEKEVLRQKAMVEMADLNNYPDINVLAGYSYRENFDNYWTFGLGMSLPIYGTEDYEEQSARKLALSVQSLSEDVKISVNSEFKTAYVQMRSAYEIYHIVEDEALPQIEHMFELTNSSIATGGDLFKYIDILVKKLKLEKKRTTAVADYSRAEAKIAALSGEIE